MSLQTDPIELARANLRIALAPFFVGNKKTAATQANKLNEAVEASLAGIQSLIRVEPVKRPGNGATVMTESASMKRGDGIFPSKPRNL